MFDPFSTYGGQQAFEAMRRDAQYRGALYRHQMEQAEQVRRAREASGAEAPPRSKFDNGNVIDFVCIDGVWQEPKALTQ